MTNEEQLKPCPFCDNRQPFLHEGSSGDWRIVCGRCLDESGTDWYPTKAQAIAAWNTRPGEERAAREAVAAFAARLMAKKAINVVRAIARWNALPDEERGAREATTRIIKELGRAIESTRRGSPTGNYPPHKAGLQRAIAIIEAMGGNEPRHAEDSKRAFDKERGKE